MPRGIPNKEPPTELELKVAEILHKNLCYVPGCMVNIHIEDARQILQVIKEATK